MHTPERRQAAPIDSHLLRDQLNESQRDALRLLEYFGWELRFVRRPPFQPAVPVIFCGDASWAVVRGDGTVDDTPTLDLR